MSQIDVVAPAEEAQGYAVPPTVFGSIRNLFREAAHWRSLAETPNGIRPALLMALIIAFGSISQYIFPVAGPNVAQDLNLNLAVIGGLFTVVGYFAIGGTLLAGWLGDRVRRVRMLAIGTILSGLSLLFMGRATDAAGIAVPQVTGAMSYDLTSVPSFSLLADWYPPQSRGRAFSLLNVGALLAPALTVLLGGVLLSAVGWRSTFVIFGLPTLLLGLLCMRLKEPIRGYFERRAMGFDEAASQREDPAQSFGEGWRATFSVRMVKRLFIADILQEIGLIPFNVFLGFYLADQYNLDAFQRGLFLAPVLLAAVLGAFLGGGLIDVMSRQSPASVTRVVAAFFLVSSVGLFGFVIGGPLWVIAVCASLTFFGFGLAGPALGALYSQVLPPSVRTQGLQVTNLSLLPAYLLLGLFGTLITDYGFGLVYSIGIGAVLVGSVVMLTAGDFFETDRRNALIAAGAGEEARRLAAEGRSKLLICRQINVSYDGVQVLFNVDFDVDEGEIVALLGTNGAGKSTLLRAISGIQEASDGAVIVDGRDVTHMPPHEIAARGVVHMPGGRGVFPGLSVEENLRLATWMADAAEVGALLEEAFALFPVLRRRRRVQAGLLSGGEQQMLGLAQAFIAKPKLLMIDELSLGLSPAVTAELLEKVEEIHRRGTTIVIVEQSVTVALNIAKRAVFMEKGEVRFAGPTAELLRRPDIVRAVYVTGSASLGSGAGGLPAASAAVEMRRDDGMQAAARTVLEVRHLSKHFGGVLALDDVSLSLAEGQILGIVGPNGSGKTTLFDVISGFQSADRGEIVYEGHDISGLSAHERARIKLIRRFQDARLFGALTVFEGLLVALDQRMEVRNAALATLRVPAARRAERRTRLQADRLIELLGLEAYRDKFIRELSTGLRRIVDLAFVLAAEPRVLLLDEPSSGVAQAEAQGLGPLLMRVRRETGCSILLIEHDIPLITAVADELVALIQGSVAARGSAAEVLGDERVVAAFLGGSQPIAAGGVSR